MNAENIVLIIVAVLGFIGAAIPGLMAWREGKKNAGLIHNLHIDVNSRLSELLQMAAAEGYATGQLLGRQEGRDEIRNLESVKNVEAAKDVLRKAESAAEAKLEKASDLAEVKLEDARNEAKRGEP